MKKSDILKKIEDLVNLLEDNVDYDHVAFTINVRDFDSDQRFSYDVDT